MALQKTIQFKGIDVANCYIRVWAFNGNKTELSFGVSFQKTASDEMFDSKTYSCEYDLVAENPIKQAYQYLKTLPEFANAKDC